MFLFLGGSYRPHRPSRRQYVLQQRVEHGQLHRQHGMKKLRRFVNEKLFLLISETFNTRKLVMKVLILIWDEKAAAFCQWKTIFDYFWDVLYEKTCDESPHINMRWKSWGVLSMKNISFSHLKSFCATKVWMKKLPQFGNEKHFLPLKSFSATKVLMKKQPYFANEKLFLSNF